MNCEINHGDGTMTLELETRKLENGDIEHEVLAQHLLQAAIQRATEQGLWNVFLVLRPEVANAEKDTLLALGFLYSGNLSRNNQTFIVAKRSIRTSGDGGGSNLACPTPQLAASATEVAAIQRFVQEHPEYQGAYERAMANVPEEKPRDRAVEPEIAISRLVEPNRHGW